MRPAKMAASRTASAKITHGESTHTLEKTLRTIVRKRIDSLGFAGVPPVPPAAASDSRRNASVESNFRDRLR
jgi:hypothetical protein